MATVTTPATGSAATTIETTAITATAVRATLRGAHEGTAAPLVVDPADPVDPAGQGNAGSSAAATLTGHRVLVLPGVPSASPGSAGNRDRSGATRQEVVIDGWRFEVDVEPERRASLRERAVRDRGEAGHSGPAELRAIIPGVVVSVAIAAGDAVEAGQELLVVEAMKMQNELRAPRAGRVARVAVGPRSTIEVGDVLVVME